MLILHHLTPYHWALSGILVGVITLLLLWLGNQRLGISTGFENLCALAVDTPYLRRPEIVESQRWRLPFLAGLVAGGALSALLGGGWSPIWALGRFDATFGWGPAAKLAWMFAGGLLIGFGTRLAGGCTSGHVISGISQLAVSGLVFAAGVFASGMLTARLVYGKGD